MKVSEILIVLSILETKTSAREMFTAYEITQDARKRGCKMPHSEMREMVHSLAAMKLGPFRVGCSGGSYKRNNAVTIKTSGLNFTAEVYAPVGVNPKSYRPDLKVSSLYQKAHAKSANKKSATKKASKTRQATRQAAAEKAVDDAKRRFTAPDGRGRVAIHNGFLVKLGRRPGNLVYVSKRKGGNGLVVLKSASKTGHLGTYKVDRSGNIRLSQKVLEAAGLSGTSKVKLRLSDDSRAIVVLKG